MWNAIVEFTDANQKELWSLGTVLFAAVVARGFRLRPKLQYSIGHSTNLLVEEPLLDAEGKQIADRQLVRTASIVIGNAGLQSAKSVELTFNWKPPIINILPARAYNELRSPFDRYSVVFESLAPSENVTVEIMSINAELPLLTSARSDDCVAKLIQMAPQRVWPNWVIRTLGGVTLLGAATAVYLTVSLLQAITS